MPRGLSRATHEDFDAAGQLPPPPPPPSPSQVPRGLSRATHEDFDAAPSGAVLSPNEGGGSGDEVTAMLADEQTNTLWTGG